jgi:tRNA-modifying protein YgfZ
MRDLRVSQDAAIPNDLSGLSALREGAAVVDFSRRILRLTGRDPIGMLNAVLTNDVQDQGDRGAYAMLLNPKGRIQTDLRVIKASEGILIDTEPEGSKAAKEILGRYAPFSRVKLEDLSESWAVLGLYGPHFVELLGNLGLAEHQSKEIEIEGQTVLAVGVEVPISGYDLIGPAADLDAIRGYLIETGATQADLAAYETSRIEAGAPRFGADITPENFPGETGVIDRAVSFEKGCYPGQETVARMHYRGHPNKTLYRLLIESAEAVPGVEIFQNDKVVGTVTSAAPLSVGGSVAALGYLSRSADTGGSLNAGDARVHVLGAVS